MNTTARNNFTIAVTDEKMRAMRANSGSEICLLAFLILGLLVCFLDLEGSEKSVSDHSDVQVISHIDPGTGFNADVVAHRGYAYLGSFGNPLEDGEFCPSQGVRVYRIQDPEHPERVSTFADGVSEPDVAGTWTEKIIVKRVHTPWFQGDLAAVSFQRCIADASTFRGFGVYDVTEPEHPVRLSLYPTETQTIGVHEIWLYSHGNHAYVLPAVLNSEFSTRPDDNTPGKPDFRIIDVSDPWNPVQVGEWGSWKELGVRPVYFDANGVRRQQFLHSVRAENNRAYLSYWDLGTVILDISDPGNPVFIGRTEFASNEEGNAHSSWLADGGNILIQTDEDFDPGPDVTGTLESSWGYPRIFDISDPSRPLQIATFKIPIIQAKHDEPPASGGWFSVHDPKVRGSLLSFSWYSEGIVLLDISHPSKPRMLAHFIPPPAEDPFGFFALPGEKLTLVWGTFIYRNYILASDINTGLWILELPKGH